MLILAYMNRKFTIIKKEEAYTFDELALLEENFLPMIQDEGQREAAGGIIRSLKLSLENQKNSSAIFFMPQNTFNIFSLIQGDNSICKITKENIEALYKAFDMIEDCESQPIYSHLKKKLKTLNEYLEQGNDVTPTVIAADNFSVMEIE